MAKLTQTGFTIRPVQEIISKISSEMKARWGDSFDTSPESPDGQLIGILSDVIATGDLAAQAAYQSSDPDSATGVALEYVCDYNGVYRQLETSTSVIVKFTGTSGTSIPQGFIVSTEGGLEFSTDHVGEVGGDVSVTCTTPGRIPVGIDEIVKVVSTISGVTGVGNDLEGITGKERESDTQLRNRRGFSVINSGTNTVEAIISALGKIGTDFVSVIENSSNEIVSDVPPKSFMVVVQGGNGSEIAQRIFDNKPIGIQAYGNTNITVRDSKGYGHEIGFSRPVGKTIKVFVSFKKVGNSASNNIAEDIREHVSHFLSNLDIGGDVLWSSVFGAAVFGANTLGTQASISEVKIGYGTASGMVDIITGPADKAVCLVTDIEVREII